MGILFTARFQGALALGPLSTTQAGKDAFGLAGFRREQELQEAIANRALFLVYQPIIRISTGETIGAEALVRWNHPVLGVLMPDTFIPFSEASGLIVPIGEFVLEQACNQLRALQIPPARCFTMSVNVSAMQLAQGDFVRVVQECMADYGVTPQRLQLEITETAPFADNAVVVKRLRQLRNFGVRIVLDDFGSGYMSLSNLRQFDVDGLKIDRSFMRSVPSDHKAKALIASMIDLAAMLELSVVVEGVETDRQAGWLRRFGDIGVQGFFYGRPAASLRY